MLSITIMKFAKDSTTWFLQSHEVDSHIQMLEGKKRGRGWMRLHQEQQTCAVIQEELHKNHNWSTLELMNFVSLAIEDGKCNGF